MQTTWDTSGEESTYPSFLANGFDEALAGAIKLARYSGAEEGRPPGGLVVDPCGKLGPFASVTLADGGRVEFVPDLVVVPEAGEIKANCGPVGASASSSWCPGPTVPWMGTARPWTS